MHIFIRFPRFFHGFVISVIFSKYEKLFISSLAVCIDTLQIYSNKKNM